MFETLPNPSLDLVLIVIRGLLLVGAVCVFALAFIRWRRADELNTQRLQQQLEKAFGELRSLHETVIVMNARLEGMSERADVGARLAPAGAVSNQRGYDVATRLAKNGADVEELVTNCGITRHEAELLVRLHAPKRRGGEVAASRLRQHAEESQPSAQWSMPQSPPQTPTTPPPAARKRGSLLSVVG